MEQSLSLVVAGYNAQDIAADIVGRCDDALSRDFADYEIIFIDDGSTDDTYARLQDEAVKRPNVRVLRNYINLNFGASVLRGLMAAQKDLVIYNAMDLPLLPENIKETISHMADNDVLVLQRTQYKATAWRQVASVINRLLMTALFPVVIQKTPVLNYIQVFRRDVIRDILPLARSPIFVWPEMVFRAKYKKLKVGNIPSTPHITNVTKGSFGKPHDIIWGVYDMLRFRVRKWFGKI